MRSGSGKGRSSISMPIASTPSCAAAALSARTAATGWPMQSSVSPGQDGKGQCALQRQNRVDRQGGGRAEILGPVRRVDTGRCGGGLQIEAQDTRGGDRASEEGHVERRVERHVIGETGTARHQRRILLPPLGPADHLLARSGHSEAEPSTPTGAR